MASEQDVLEQARGVRADAQRLLEAEGLFPLISAVGPAVVVGSVALDLMTWPDIDVDLELPHPRDAATMFDLGREIATRFEVTDLTFQNHFLRPDSPYGQGLYLGSRLRYRGRSWKLDVWGHSTAAFSEKRAAFEALRQRLEGADRLAILRIKAAVCDRPEYRHGMYSVDIYEAVAAHQVRTPEEFDAWFRSRGRQESRSPLA